MSAGVIGPVCRQIKVLGESWQDDRDYGDSEESLSLAMDLSVVLFQHLQRSHEQWQQLVDAGQLDYSLDTLETIKLSYENWLKVAQGITERLPSRKGSDEFQECRRRAQEILENENAEWNLWKQVQALSPSNEKLLALAGKSPPSQEWFDGE